MCTWCCVFGFLIEVLGTMRVQVVIEKDSYISYKYHLLSAYYIPGTVLAFTHVV